jgi:hypothetical protein
MATNRNFRINAGIQVGTTANVVGMMTSNAYMSNKTDVLTTPDLCLDFTKGMIDSRVKTIRTSNASFVNSSLKIQAVGANTPRVEFDLATGQCMGLVCEDQRVNLVGYSDIEGPIGTIPRNMASAGTPSTVVTVSNDVWIGPNKASAKHVYDGSGGSDNNSGYFSGALASGANVNSSISFGVYVYIPSNSVITNCYMSVESSTMTFTGTNLSVANLSIRDKWQRLSATTFVAANTGSCTPVFRMSPIGAYAYTDCWQMEFGEYLSTWIPTTNVGSAQRNEDINYVPFSAVSATPNPTNFTMYAEVVPKWTANSTTANSVNAQYAQNPNPNYGTGNRGIMGLTWRFTVPLSSINAFVYNGYAVTVIGLPQYDFSYSSRGMANTTSGFAASGNILNGGPANTGYNYPGATMTANTPIKFAFAMNSISGDAFVVNGNSSLLATSTTTYNGNYVDVITLGYQYAGGVPTTTLCGNMKKFLYFQKSLSNNELIALTET